MTHDEVEAIMTLYRKLMKEIQEKSVEFTPPELGFKISSISFDPDGCLEVEWKNYIGCGEYEYATTYPRLEDFFKD